MRRREVLICDKCHTMQVHSPEGDTAAKCETCGTMRDASFEFGRLSLMETHRATFVRHRYRQGLLTEWPPQPGVWA